MGENGPEVDIQDISQNSPQEEVNPNRNPNLQPYGGAYRQHVAASSRPEEAMLITAIILACAYCFVAGQFFEFLSKNEPSLTTVKSLLLSLSWPGNVAMFLLMRCVR